MKRFPLFAGGAVAVATAIVASLAWGAAEQSVPKSVSAEEYRAAFSEFQTCMIGRGFSVSDPVVSPVDGMQLIYEIRSSEKDGPGTASFDECYDLFGRVEADYFENGHPRMADDLSAEVANCLNRRGVAQVEKVESVRALRDKLGANNDKTIDECVTESSSKLYPEIPFIPLS